ncbi:MAG: phosphotransferase [Verrucomicrobiales bacterium]|nr:phosphotransferase [Verrucomicrobiales bacterium]
MLLDLSELEKRTRAQLSDWREASLEFAVIEKGGSGRMFVRVRNLDEGSSVIAMHYSDERSDNLRFADVTDFLNRKGVPSPRIIDRQISENILWVEDLGEKDLTDLAGSSWSSVRGGAYESALRAVYQLHQIREDQPPADLPELEIAFDESLYRWEQEYFIHQFVERFLPAGLAEELLNDASLKELSRSLSALPRALLHRDFQSTNVMMVDGNAFLIDYQGLRWGLPEYDLASLVYDPYTTFSETEREHLIRYYFSLRTKDDPTLDFHDFSQQLARCATQRLMQALGAYGFLSEVKGKREFLQHIPTAQARLKSISRSEGGLAVLAEILDHKAEI